MNLEIRLQDGPTSIEETRSLWSILERADLFAMCSKVVFILLLTDLSL